MGSKSQVYIWFDEKGDCQCLSTSLLQPKETDSLQTDTSIKGLGACMLQDEKPVYFANNALTDAEKGYVAIELESLAVVWVMEKFHHFFYTSHFILETD